MWTQIAFHAPQKLLKRGLATAHATNLLLPEPVLQKRPQVLPEPGAREHLVVRIVCVLARRRHRDRDRGQIDDRDRRRFRGRAGRERHVTERVRRERDRLEEWRRRGRCSCGGERDGWDVGHATPVTRHSWRRRSEIGGGCGGA